MGRRLPHLRRLRHLHHRRHDHLEASAACIQNILTRLTVTSARRSILRSSKRIARTKTLGVLRRLSLCEKQSHLNSTVYLRSFTMHGTSVSILLFRHGLSRGYIVTASAFGLPFS